MDNLNGIHIFVDDEPDSRDFVAFVLEQAQAIVTSGASGFEALQIIEQSVPNLILSNIGMPEMDGYRLLQQIRALEPMRQVPAIALTAYAGEYDRQQAMQAGFQNHMPRTTGVILQSSRPLKPDLAVALLPLGVRDPKK